MEFDSWDGRYCHKRQEITFLENNIIIIIDSRKEIEWREVKCIDEWGLSY